MIYKVFFQASTTEVPVREHTDSLYVEAVSERDVRDKLKNIATTLNSFSL